MDPEEADLQNDYRYRSYGVVIEKALRSFESSSEWADLISSLGKLNKVRGSPLLKMKKIRFLTWHVGLAQEVEELPCNRRLLVRSPAPPS